MDDIRLLEHIKAGWDGTGKHVRADRGNLIDIPLLYIVPIYRSYGMVL